MNRKAFVFTAGAGAFAALPSVRAMGSPLLPAFHFNNGFWMNLHHTLYYQMQAIENAYQKDDGYPLDQAALADYHRIPVPHHRDWYEALSVYHRNYAHADFVFDETLSASDHALTFVDATTGELPNALPAEMVKALQSAAPVYESTLWPTHRAQNDLFIANIDALLAQYGDAFRTRVPQVLEAPWLAQPHRVDVVAYSDRDGSYCNTTDTFVHIIMSSSDPAQHGPSSLDVLFHEASHAIAGPYDGTIGGPIVAASRTLQRLVPDEFWHTVLMFTPGRIAEEAFTAAGVPYTMVWLKRDGLFTQVWPRYYAVLQKYWQPHMDGKTDRVTALTACVNAIVT